MTKHKKYFADMYEKYLQNVDRVRIVPIKTKELNQGLASYIIITDDEKKIYILERVEEIKKILNEDEFIFSKEENQLKVKFEDEKLNEAITQALDIATIISMYIDLEGEIYLNHTKVGDIVSIEDEKAVDKEKIIDVMKESFLKVVDGYSKKSTAK